MQVALKDKDKNPMFFLGSKLHLTYDSPGPVDVNLEELSDQEKTQLLFNVNRGVLSVDSPEELKVKSVSPAKSYSQAQQQVQQRIPITTGVMATRELPTLDPAKPIFSKKDKDPASERSKQLRALLKEKVSSIKKHLLTLRLSDIRELLELEKKGKKRKSLLVIFQERLNVHAQSVLEKVGQEGITDLDDNAKQLRGSLSPQAYLDSISDVVESEHQDITVKVGEDPEDYSE